MLVATDEALVPVGGAIITGERVTGPVGTDALEGKLRDVV